MLTAALLLASAQCPDRSLQIKYLAGFRTALTAEWRHRGPQFVCIKERRAEAGQRLPWVSSVQVALGQVECVRGGGACTLHCSSSDWHGSSSQRGFLYKESFSLPHSFVLRLAEAGHPQGVSGVCGSPKPLTADDPLFRFPLQQGIECRWWSVPTWHQTCSLVCSKLVYTGELSPLRQAEEGSEPWWPPQ